MTTREAIKRQMKMLVDFRTADGAGDQLIEALSRAAGRPIDPKENMLALMAEIDAKTANDGG